jgi:hypothetical protein
LPPVAPFADSVDGRIAHQDLQAGRHRTGYIEGGITLSSRNLRGNARRSA